QPGFSARTQGGVHPVAGFALLNAGKSDALDLKLSANQRIQIHACDKGVAPRGRRLSKGQAKFATQSVQNLHGKERDLPLIVLFEVEETISPDAAAGNAVDLIHFHDWILPGGLTVV